MYEKSTIHVDRYARPMDPVGCFFFLAGGEKRGNERMSCALRGYLRGWMGMKLASFRILGPAIFFLVVWKSG